MKRISIWDLITRLYFSKQKSFLRDLWISNQEFDIWYFFNDKRNFSGDPTDKFFQYFYLEIKYKMTPTFLRPILDVWSKA